MISHDSCTLISLIHSLSQSHLIAHSDHLPPVLENSQLCHPDYLNRSLDCLNFLESILSYEENRSLLAGDEEDRARILLRGPTLH